MSKTLSLADVARLSHVSRPVVSMWRKRPKDGIPFPSPCPDGRFDADEMIDWLERTGRGNNPDARRDLTITAVQATFGTDELEDLLVLLAAKAVTGLTLDGCDPEELLDRVDELDPDDLWLFGEVEAVDVHLLAHEADTVCDDAWSTAEAYETLLARLRSRSGTEVGPGDEVVTLLGSLAGALRGDRGALVDVAGSATDVLIALQNHDEALDAPVVLPLAAAGSGREARRRYAVHGLRPRSASFGDDWGLPDGSVVLAALPSDPDAALDLVDEVAVQLGGMSTAVVVGPASVLIDELPAALESRRDGFLRDPGRTLAAAVRLPQGLTRSGGREHLAIWVLQAGAPEVTRVGDLAGYRASPSLWQQVLDDLLAVASGVRLRAFAVLHRVPAATLLASGGSLVGHDLAVASELPASAGDDAARIQQLVDTVSAPLPEPFAGHALAVAGSRAARHLSLGEASRAKRVHILSGTRMEALPEGTTVLWTADALAQGGSSSVDLLAFSAAHPDAQLTEPGDVVFTSAGAPAAVVDTVGGAVVAFPARTIRVAPGQPLSPRAIAAAINELAERNSNWRTWPIPVVDGDPAEADGVLALVDALAETLRQRQTQVDELRRLVVRAVLPGAVAFHEIRPDEVKGD